VEKIGKKSAGDFTNQQPRQGQMMQNDLNIPELKKLPASAISGDRGFTIAELLVAMALMAVLMSGMVKLFSLLNQSYTTQNVAAGVQQVVRTGIDIMTQKIRIAGFNPLKLSDVGIQADFSENSIHFSYDLDADGIVADEEDIRFFHEDQKLKRQIRTGNRIALIDNVTDLKFAYLDVNDQIAANHADIKTVVISMTVSEPAGRRQALSRTYSTRVLCRNLGL
jgi:prepilin-type N-terminal cleavage/methylation domain-containing protein